MKFSCVLAIPDLHAPFHSPDALRFLKEIKREFEPDKVVLLGDEIDGYMFSRFRHLPEAKNAEDELEDAIHFMKQLYKLFSEASCCIGNHTLRHMKKAIEAGLPVRLFKDLHALLEAPKGWQWKTDWLIDGVYFSHGEQAIGSDPIRNLILTKNTNCVIGHRHARPELVYINNGNKLLWGMDCGCLIDHEAYAFDYAKDSLRKSVNAVGLLLDRGSSYLPLIVPLK